MKIYNLQLKEEHLQKKVKAQVSVEEVKRKEHDNLQQMKQKEWERHREEKEARQQALQLKVFLASQLHGQKSKKRNEEQTMTGTGNLKMKMATIEATLMTKQKSINQLEMVEAELIERIKATQLYNQ